MCKKGSGSNRIAARGRDASPISRVARAVSTITPNRGRSSRSSFRSHGTVRRTNDEANCCDKVRCRSQAGSHRVLRPSRSWKDRKSSGAPRKGEVPGGFGTRLGAANTNMVAPKAWFPRLSTTLPTVVSVPMSKAASFADRRPVVVRFSSSGRGELISGKTVPPSPVGRPTFYVVENVRSGNATGVC